MKRDMISALLAGAFLIGAATPLPAQDAAAGAAKGFSPEQLEQMVAPIALYPDSLVTQILMAATYPLEIVEADRWLQKQGGATTTTLDDALKGEDWDPSVKSLVKVPDVLRRMSENLDWTRDLGDAFLGQKTEVLDAVQRMRGKAKEAGNLKTTEQQTVTSQPDNIIVIESSSPEVVYVPTYSTVVYGGGWSYPTPYYPYMYPPGYGLLAFGTGVAVGAALWGNCNWGWGHGDCNINVNNYNNFNKFTSNNVTNLQGNRQSWNHNPAHREGVNYRNNQVAQKYGGTGTANRVASDRARGRTDVGTGANRPGAGAGGAAGGARPGAGGAGAGGAAGGARPGAGGAGAGGAARPSGGASQRPSGGFSGASSPKADRAASNRGSSSRGSSGGGARAGGGGARGGGGGRRR